MGCSPALEDRPGGRDRAPSLAEVVDKGAYTDRVGYTHPTPALRLRPTPDRLPTWRGPRRPKTNFVDKGAFTGRMGYAHPTDAPGPAGPEPRPAGLSDPQERHRRQKASQAAQGAALRPVPRLCDLCPALAAPWTSWRPLGRRGGGSAAGRPPQPRCAPCGLRLAPQALTRPSAPAEGLP